MNAENDNGERLHATRHVGAERLRDLLRWRRIPGGLRYMRRFGLMELLRRLFPQFRSYNTWIRIYDTLTDEDVAAVLEHIRALHSQPLISILMPVAPSDRAVAHRAIKGIAAQLYPSWELCIAGDTEIVRLIAEIAKPYIDAGCRIKLADAGAEADLAAAFNAALAVASGTLVTMVRAADQIAAHALYMFAVELAKDPEVAILYSDEDAIGPNRLRHNPCFKSDWDPDLLLGEDAFGRLVAYRRDLVVAAGGWRSGFRGAEEHDLALRASERVDPERIRHVPMILYHRLRMTGSAAGPSAENGHCQAVAEHLGRTGIAGIVEPLSEDRVRVRRGLPEKVPGVSLIVPTRDQVDLLRRCINGLLNGTDYDNFEIVIVDNNSVAPDSHAYFADLATIPNVRILNYPGPFNYSAINNFAVRHVQHEIIGLLNNDIEVIHADWLQEMVSHALRPQVGAVGAKLYYPNERIQHAGTILGLGGAAGHAFRHFHRTAPGYCGRLLLTRNLSAVTAACMLLRRSVFEEIGGFDETNLAVAFNDVDLCLRLREKGYRIVWTPFAELYHWESVSRGSDLAPEQIERFRREMKYLTERWRAVIAYDPYYNPNLTVEGEDFDLAFPPRVLPPWVKERFGNADPV